MDSGKKFKILMMVSWYSPKGEKRRGGTFHYEQAMDLKRNCECAIYYPYDRTLDSPFYKGEDWGILTYRSRYALEKKLRNRIYMYRAMREITKEYHPDLIHAQVATEAGRFAAMLGVIFGIPVIITEHSAVEASGADCFPHYYYARFAYGHSMYNACVSDSLKKKLEKIFPQYTFHTVYNGIREILPEKKIVASYRKDGLINVAVVAGGYDRRIKGFQFLFPAIHRIIAEGGKLMLHIVGGGQYYQEFMDLAKEMGIWDNCVFYGHCEREKVYDIVSEMDFMVSASLFESFGCSIAEGMMLGKPAVGTRCGGLESIINEQTGILVEKESEDALYYGIKQMMQKYPSFEAEKIAEYAYEKFAVSKISQQYLQIYEQAINEYKRKRRLLCRI